MKSRLQHVTRERQTTASLLLLVLVLVLRMTSYNSMQ